MKGVSSSKFDSFVTNHQKGVRVAAIVGLAIIISTVAALILCHQFCQCTPLVRKHIFISAIGFGIAGIVASTLLLKLISMTRVAQQQVSQPAKVATAPIEVTQKTKGSEVVDLDLEWGYFVTEQKLAAAVIKMIAEEDIKTRAEGCANLLIGSIRGGVSKDGIKHILKSYILSFDKHLNKYAEKLDPRYTEQQKEGAKEKQRACYLAAVFTYIFLNHYFYIETLDQKALKPIKEAIAEAIEECDKFTLTGNGSNLFQITCKVNKRVELKVNKKLRSIDPIQEDILTFWIPNMLKFELKDQYHQD